MLYEPVGTCVCARAAIVQQQLEDVQARKRCSLRVDRRNQWESIAGDAQRAADRGDMRELFKLARRLGAFKPTPVAWSEAQRWYSDI